jgi:hypothetical protein
MTHRSIKAGLVALLTIATGSFLFASCNGSNSESPAESPGTIPTAGATPSATASPTATPTINVKAWDQVSERTNCEAMTPDACRGAYGFTVFSDGTWAAGPSPSGKTYSGQLSDNQLSAIQTDIGLFSPSDLTSDLVCTQAQAIPGKQDTLQIWYGDQPFTMYQYAMQGGAECYSGNDKTDARLLVDIRALMQQYYPVPFEGSSPTPSPSVSVTPVPEPTVTILPSPSP